MMRVGEIVFLREKYINSNPRKSVQQLMKKEGAINLKERKTGSLGGFGVGKKREK